MIVITAIQRISECYSLEILVYFSLKFCYEKYDFKHKANYGSYY